MDSASGLPCSAVINTARSSAFAIIESARVRRIFARSFAVMARQAGSAAFAASIARRVSATPILGTVPITLPVAGLVTSIVSFEPAPTHWPSI